MVPQAVAVLEGPLTSGACDGRALEVARLYVPPQVLLPLGDMATQAAPQPATLSSHHHIGVT